MDGWFYEVDGERRGPFSFAAIQELVRLGAIRRYTLVFEPGAEQPVQAGTLNALIVRPQQAAVLFTPGYSKPAMVSMLLGVLSFIPLVGYAGLVVTGFAIRDLRRHRELKGDGRAVVGGLLSLAFSILYTYAFWIR
jgi:hypothetical protein